VLRAVDEIKRGDEPQHYGRRAFNREHPLPAVQTQHAAHIAHDPARHQAAEHARNRNAREENRQHGRAPARRIPIGQIQYDARKKAGFEDAKHEAQQIEVRGRRHHHHADRRHAPQQHDPRERAARAESRKQEIAGHFEQHIADIEHGCAETVHGVAETKVVLHLQLREANVDSIQERHDITEKQKRHDTQRYFAIQQIVVRGSA